jgi:hypothetical protein
MRFSAAWYWQRKIREIVAAALVLLRPFVSCIFVRRAGEFARQL